MITKRLRIQSDIETLSTFNDSDGDGLTRLSFTSADLGARAFLKNALSEFGLEPFDDAAGSVVARREGSDSNAPAIMIGSHFDSVKNGGNFDGPAGVVMALEIMRCLEEQDVKLVNPVEFVAMIEEEGGRFGSGVFGSRAMTGKVSYEMLQNAKDDKGISMAEAFEVYGLNPKNILDAYRSPEKVKAFLELHIEQGPILEKDKIDVGIVKEVVGICQIKVQFEGRPDHAGTTPMPFRKDALVMASELIASIPEIAKAAGNGTVSTVGQLDVRPGAANIVPAKVILTVDIRSKNSDSINYVIDNIGHTLEALKRKHDVSYKQEIMLMVDPVIMDESMSQKLVELAESLNFSSIDMASGAGHDAMIMASMVPSALVFVPSKDGRSHCKEEWTDYDALQKGIELIYHMVIELGRQKND